jgi:methionyl aminopeptidase
MNFSLSPSYKFVKNNDELKIMREGGKIMAAIMADLKSMIEPGLDVWQLEEAFIKLCESYKVIPECKGYSSYGLSPFPTGLCVSINSQSVHCFPKKGTILQKGDIITVDTVIKHKTLNLDSAFASVVGGNFVEGNTGEKRLKLAKTAETALYESIALVKAGERIGVISNKMQTTAQANGFDVLRDYGGHGIGYLMHEWPQILCYGSKNDGPKLTEGLTICIEALLCSGKPKVRSTSEWETKMADNSDFAQFEHTVLVTKNGYEILT